ncbi:MAG: TadE family protein [Anaerolineaceae bacterium]|nr:TadE family protein [Anaerolineaceae bacterium]
MKKLLKQMRKKKNYLQKGQSLVELAISMTLLFILLAGVVDFGRAIMAYFVLQDAAEEGIVFGTSYPTDCNQILDRIHNNIDNQINNNATIINVSIEDDAGVFQSCYSIPFAQVYAGKLMKIEITNDFPITMPFLGSILGSQTIPLSITTNGTILRPPPPI